MLRRVISATVLVGLAGGALAQDAATGFVYHDKNGNRQKEPHEPGIAGVLVSNEREVTKTDADGRWSLPVDDDTVFFVVQPPGWRVPTTPSMLPRHFYLHKPGGSPDDNFVFPGVDATGPLPASIDFALEQPSDGDTAQQFKVLLFGDTQPYSIEQVDFIEKDAIGHARRVGADFGISLGDLVGDDLDLFQPLNGAISTIGVPWWNVYGNHDMNPLAPGDEHADETFNRVFGPANYAFQRGRATFIVLDNVIWQGFEGFNDGSAPWTGYGRTDERGFPGVGNYVGGLSSDQLAFVRNVLEHVPSDDLVVIATHIPLLGQGKHQTPQLEQLNDILSGHERVLSLSGHTHVQRHFFFGSEHGYTGQGQHHHLNAGAVSGTWWRGAKDELGIPHATMRDGAPNGFWTLNVTGNAYTLDFHPARRDAGDQMHIYIPHETRAGRGTDVMVNVFAGSEKDTVECRLGDGPWQRLAFDPAAIDPRYLALRDFEAANPPVDSQPVRNNPVPTHHLWSGSLPSRGPGTYRVLVRWTDQWGRVTEETRALRVR